MFACLLTLVKKAVKTESAVIIIKPNINSNAYTSILEVLENYKANNIVDNNSNSSSNSVVGIIKIVSKGQLPANEKARNKIISQHFLQLHKYAELIAPIELNLSQEEVEMFEKCFNESWDVAITAGKIYNAAGARKYLKLVSASSLYHMWQHKNSLRVRLSNRGLHCARLQLDNNAGNIYVINGFYSMLLDQYCKNNISIKKMGMNSSNSSVVGDICDSSSILLPPSPDYLVIEWDSQHMTWTELHKSVVGAKDPQYAEPGSIRYLMYNNWRELGLTEKPDQEHNCVHVSSSAFEGMVERLNWCKGSILFTDVLGAQFIAASIPAFTLQNWLSNPVLNNRHIFDHMRGMGSTDCIAIADTLLGNIIIFLSVLFQF